MRLNGRVDSIPYLQTFQKPVLWLLGSKDTQVPTAVSEPRLREAFAKAGNAKVTLRVFSPASHGMFEVEEDAQGRELPIRRTVEGYWDTVGAWIDAVVLPPR